MPSLFQFAAISVMHLSSILTAHLLEGTTYALELKTGRDNILPPLWCFCRKYRELVFNFKRSYDQTLRGLTYKNAEVLWHSCHRCSCKGCCLLEHIFLRSPLTNTWTKLHDNQWRSKEKVLAWAHVYRSPTNIWTNMTMYVLLTQSVQGQLSYLKRYNRYNHKMCEGCLLHVKVALPILKWAHGPTKDLDDRPIASLVLHYLANWVCKHLDIVMMPYVQQKCWHQSVLSIVNGCA